MSGADRLRVVLPGKWEEAEEIYDKVPAPYLDYVQTLPRLYSLNRRS